MTTLTVTLTGVCSGGNHLTYSITGVKSMTVQGELSHISESVTDDDVQAFCKVIARMAKAGRTVNQARTLLQAGVTVTA